MVSVFTQDTIRPILTTIQFQQQVPGNVIPMQAFINQMHDTMIDGKPAVSAKVVSYWQGFAEMSKTVGMFAGGWFADRFGRK
jgi:SP family general alpha glucoside:H+ symporter-like MFS transporter